MSGSGSLDCLHSNDLIVDLILDLEYLAAGMVALLRALSEPDMELVVDRDGVGVDGCHGSGSTDGSGSSWGGTGGWGSI